MWRLRRFEIGDLRFEAGWRTRPGRALRANLRVINRNAEGRSVEAGQFDFLRGSWLGRESSFAWACAESEEPRRNTARQSRNSKFKIPNSRACNENDSGQESLRAAKKFAHSSTKDLPPRYLRGTRCAPSIGLNFRRPRLNAAARRRPAPSIAPRSRPSRGATGTGLLLQPL